MTWCITVTFPQLPRGVSEKQLSRDTASQASTATINSCKSRWWAWASRETVARYGEWKIHLNRPNQSNIYPGYCALCETQMTLEPEKTLVGGQKSALSSQTNQKQNRGRKTEHTDIVLVCFDARGLSQLQQGSWGGLSLETVAAPKIWMSRQETDGLMYQDLINKCLFNTTLIQLWHRLDLMWMF